jgi:hypothetical protein
MNKKHTGVYLLILVLLVVIAANALAFHIIRKENQRASVFEQQVATLKAQEEDQRKNEVAAKEVGDQVNFVKENFLREGEIVSFIEYLEKMASQSNVEVSISSLGVVDLSAAKKPVKKTASSTNEVILKDQVLNVRLEAGGSWRDLNNFIARLENMPYASEVKNLSLDMNSRPKLFFPPESESTGEEKVKWTVVAEISVLTI